ncbi:MAG: zinc ribbon domain-containing protein [Chloroflexota bacterium]
MALQALRSVFSRGDATADHGGAAAPADPTVSGGTDDAVFGCPACGRTIPRGSFRCQGCGQRLVLDVPVNRASMLLGAGLLAGLLTGGALVGLTVPRQAVPAGTAGAASGAPGPTSIPAAVASSSLAALRGTTTLNGRLAAQAEPLARALAAKKLAVPDVVAVLRRMSADTRAAAAMVPSLGSWDEAAEQQAALGSFYAALTAELDTGLGASVKSAGAYKRTAQRVIALLARVPDLDAASRTLAAGMGADLPAVDFPDVLLGD